MEKHPEIVDKLWENARYLKDGLTKLGYNLGVSQSPITPVVLGDEVLTQKFSRALIDNGVYAKSIVFPTVPLGTGRVRNMPTVEHTKEMLDKVIEVYARVGRDLGIIK